MNCWRQASLKRTSKTTKNIGTVEKMKLNAKSELNELKAMSDRNKLGHELNPELSRRLKIIDQASNPENFFAPCMDIARYCKQSDFMFAYIYMIAGDGQTVRRNRCFPMPNSILLRMHLPSSRILVYISGRLHDLPFLCEPH